MIDYRTLEALIGNLTRRIEVLESRDPSVGSGQWTDFTGTLVQAVGITFTNNCMRWTRVGKVVFIEVNLHITSAGTAANSIIFSLPAALAVPTMRNLTLHMVHGSGVLYDSSANAFYGLLPHPRSAVDIYFLGVTAPVGNLFGIDPAITLASGDQLMLDFHYETSD